MKIGFGVGAVARVCFLATFCLSLSGCPNVFNPSLDDTVKLKVRHCTIRRRALILNI